MTTPKPHLDSSPSAQASGLTREGVEIKLQGAQLLLSDGKTHAKVNIRHLIALCEHYLSTPAVAPAVPDAKRLLEIADQIEASWMICEKDSDVVFLRTLAGTLSQSGDGEAEYFDAFKALLKISSALGNPCLEATGDQTLEDALAEYVIEQASEKVDKAMLLLTAPDSPSPPPAEQAHTDAQGGVMDDQVSAALDAYVEACPPAYGMPYVPALRAALQAALSANQAEPGAAQWREAIDKHCENKSRIENWSVLDLDAIERRARELMGER